MNSYKNWKVNEEECKEALSDYAHDVWSRWMKHLFSVSEQNKDGSVTIPKEFVDRWKRQIATKYADLTAKEQQSDQKEADNILNIVKKHKSS